MRERLEAVTVCVGYSDFLAETLPHNLQHFDRYVVVTTFDDHDTQTLCRRLSVECRPTDVFTHGGDPFAKGRGIDFGLGFLRRDQWLIHLDADTWLPPNTRRWLEHARPDADCIYGIDRVNCTGYEAWRKFLASACAHPVHQHVHHCLVMPPPFPLGARVSLKDHAGYVPIGFFQLWHGKHGRRYPLEQGDAEHTDVLHALQWPTDKRRLLPEIIAVHLESEPCRMGANWRGRRTQHFGPHRHHPHPRPAAGNRPPYGA